VSTPPYVALPIGVTVATVATAVGDFAALQAGDAADDTPRAVLVPGFTGSKEDFIAVLAPMAAAGFFVTAFDQRGQWETKGPAAVEEYDLAGFGADLVALATVLGERVHVVGHSYGGLVAREAVIAVPERFASVTLLCSGPAALPHPQRDELALFADVLDEHGLEVLWAAKTALEREQGNEGPDDPEVAQFLDRRFLASSPGSLLRMARDLVDTSDRTEGLRATGVPTQVVWGEADHYWPPDLQRQMAQRLNAGTVEIAGAAHSPNVEQPQALVQIVTAFWGATS
jgi:pimeloyl-ACP methyl ester carboxylesterase